MYLYIRAITSLFKHTRDNNWRRSFQTPTQSYCSNVFVYGRLKYVYMVTDVLSPHQTSWTGCGCLVTDCLCLGLTSTHSRSLMFVESAVERLDVYTQCARTELRRRASKHMRLVCKQERCFKKAIDNQTALGRADTPTEANSAYWISDDEDDDVHP